MTKPTDRHKWLWFGVRVVVVAIILAVIGAKINFGKMGAAIRGAAHGPILLAVLLFLLNRVITAAKWDLLLRRNGIRAGLLRLIRIMFESSFLGMAIPSGLGVDIARLARIRMDKHNLTSSASSILADRILAVLTLAVLSVVAACLCWSRVDDRHTIAVVIVLGTLAAASILLLMSNLSLRAYSFFHTGLCALLARVGATGGDPDSGLAGTIKDKVTEIHGSLAGLLKDPVALGMVTGMNLVVQCVRVIQVHLLFLAIGETVPVLIEVAFVPMILLIKLFPISPYMGIGVTEGAFVYFFSRVGIASEISLSASILTHLVVIIGIIPGAMLFFLGRTADRSVPDAPPAPGAPPSLPWRAAIMLLAAGLIAFFRYTFVSHQQFFRHICREDGIVETAQFGFFLAAAIVGIWLSIRLWRRRDYWVALPYTVFALGCFFIAGEEICWGQRALEYATPEALLEINAQREATVHNIKDVQKKLYHFCALIGAYACVTGALQLLPRLRKHRIFRYYTVHPACVFYFVPALVYGVFRMHYGPYWRAFKRVFGRLAKPLSVLQEPVELGIAMGFFLITVIALLMSRAEDKQSQDGKDSPSELPSTGGVAPGGGGGRGGFPRGNRHHGHKRDLNVQEFHTRHEHPGDRYSASLPQRSVLQDLSCSPESIHRGLQRRRSRREPAVLRVLCDRRARHLAGSHVSARQGQP
ncbi:lysylphosphatidylglycerol synthase transmembrane domain-containing protein [Verrucomicrobiota bacterium]